MDNEADYVDEQLNEIIKEIREDSIKPKNVTKDPFLTRLIDDLPPLCQVQYDLYSQLVYLKKIAFKYGLHDAATCIEKDIQYSNPTY